MVIIGVVSIYLLMTYTYTDVVAWAELSHFVCNLLCVIWWTGNSNMTLYFNVVE